MKLIWYDEEDDENNSKATATAQRVRRNQYQHPNRCGLCMEAHLYVITFYSISYVLRYFARVPMLNMGFYV